MTQADMACVAIADSSQSRFIVICLSNGASNLYVSSLDEFRSLLKKIPTGIWKDMMTVSGTILLTYFATEIAEMSTEGEDYMVSLHFLHKCMVALIQVTKTTRDIILTRRHRCKFFIEYSSLKSINVWNVYTFCCSEQ